MLIKCWGARGSIPVSGTEYQKYGGDTACIEIRTSNDNIIIIDAGSGVRQLGNILKDENRSNHINFIFTHAHWDHLLGFPFFKPIYIPGNQIDIYGCPFSQESIKRMFSDSLIPPFFPIGYHDLKADLMFHGAPDGSFRIDSVEIVPISLSHPNYAIGYKFIENGKSFVFLTDNELTHQHPGGMEYNDYLEFSKNADVLFHDSEFKADEYTRTKGWGHTIYTDALKLALDANVKKFGLYHHNQDRSDYEIDHMVEDCNRIIAEKGSSLECIGVSSGTEIEL